MVIYSWKNNYFTYFLIGIECHRFAINNLLQLTDNEELITREDVINAKKIITEQWEKSGNYSVDNEEGVSIKTGLMCPMNVMQYICENKLKMQIKRVKCKKIEDLMKCYQLKDKEMLLLIHLKIIDSFGNEHIHVVSSYDGIVFDSQLNHGVDIDVFKSKINRNYIYCMKNLYRLYMLYDIKSHVE